MLIDTVTLALEVPVIVGLLFVSIAPSAGVTTTGAEGTDVSTSQVYIAGEGSTLPCVATETGPTGP